MGEGGGSRGGEKKRDKEKQRAKPRQREERRKRDKAVAKREEGVVFFFSFISRTLFSTTSFPEP